MVAQFSREDQIRKRLFGEKEIDRGISSCFVRSYVASYPNLVIKGSR